nr:unnamed protein product [Callosobruchus chinensis]
MNCQTIRTRKRSATPASSQRRKRETADYQYENEEYPLPVHQNILDYEDLIQQLNAPIYDGSDKRFLGRLPQMGKPKSTPMPKTRRYQ